MTYTPISYPQDKSFHRQYYEVLSFLSKHNEKHAFIHFHWSRWEWMFGRDNLIEEELANITLFYDNTQTLCGALIYEDRVHARWFAIYEDEPLLKQTMISYWLTHINQGVFIVLDDPIIHRLLTDAGYVVSKDSEPLSYFAPTTFLATTPPGYQIIPLSQDYRLDQVHHALYRGFDHGDEVDYSQENLESRRMMTSTPHYNRDYTFVAVYDNKFVAFANIFYLPGTTVALVEPVATVPDHRKKGLARACLLHAIAAVKTAGAQHIYVGATLDLYLNMGFVPQQKVLRYRQPTTA